MSQWVVPPSDDCVIGVCAGRSRNGKLGELLVCCLCRRPARVDHRLYRFASVLDFCLTRDRSVDDHSRRKNPSSRKKRLAAACGIIFAALFGVGEFDASDRSAFDRWCDTHPHSVPAVLIISSGLSFASAYLAFQSKGDGRRLLMICALVVAALSFLGAVLLMNAL